MSGLLFIVRRALHWCGWLLGERAEQLELPLRFSRRRKPRQP